MYQIPIKEPLVSHSYVTFAQVSTSCLKDWLIGHRNYICMRTLMPFIILDSVYYLLWLGKKGRSKKLASQVLLKFLYYAYRVCEIVSNSLLSCPGGQPRRLTGAYNIWGGVWSSGSSKINHSQKYFIPGREFLYVNLSFLE